MSKSMVGHLTYRIAMKARSAVHERTGKVLAESLEMPRTMLGRGLGLMFRKTLDPGRGMWIVPCSSIHMMFMNFAIDAVFLDGRERVKKVYRKLPRWYGAVWWEIGRPEEPLCMRCGVELRSARRECGCRARLKSLTRLRSAVAYEGPIEPAVQRFKYEGWRRLAGPLAQLISERLAIEGVAARWVVAVPLHPQRLRQRGFNQADLLAGELRKRLALASPPGVLVRMRPTPPQVGRDRKRRFENVVGAFAWRGSGLQGESILLIDPVATTGATLDACASTLRQAAAAPVTELFVSLLI